MDSCHRSCRLLHNILGSCVGQPCRIEYRSMEVCLAIFFFLTIGACVRACVYPSGLVIGLFYHLYTHDQEGSIGITLRSIVQATGIQGSMEDKLFATIVVTSFMEVTGMLMLPEFYGPSFNLLLLPKQVLADAFVKPSKKVLKKSPAIQNDTPAPTAGKKGKKNKKKTN